MPQEPHHPRPGERRTSPPRGRARSRAAGARALRLAGALLALGLVPGGVQAADEVPGAGTATDALGTVLAAVGARPHSQARFVEHQFLKILDRPLESRGELRFTPPDRLEKRTLAPRPESLVVEAGQLTLERGKRHMRVALSSYPQLAPLVEGIRATLAGDRATLERLFEVGFAPGADWSLTLRPRDAQLARIVHELRIGGRGSDVLRVETLRGDGDRSVMDVTPLDPP